MGTLSGNAVEKLQKLKGKHAFRLKIGIPLLALVLILSFLFCFWKVKYTASYLYDKSGKEIGFVKDGQKYYDWEVVKNQTDKAKKCDTLKAGDYAGEMNPYELGQMDWFKKQYVSNGSFLSDQPVFWISTVYYCGFSEDADNIFWVSPDDARSRLYIKEGFVFPDYETDPVDAVRFGNDTEITDASEVSQIVGCIRKRAALPAFVRQYAKAQKTIRVFVKYKGLPLYECVGTLDAHGDFSAFSS